VAEGAFRARADAASAQIELFWLVGAAEGTVAKLPPGPVVGAGLLSPVGTHWASRLAAKGEFRARASRARSHIVMGGPGLEPAGAAVRPRATGAGGDPGP
jgi:hypothetical protein